MLVTSHRPVSLSYRPVAYVVGNEAVDDDWILQKEFNWISFKNRSLMRIGIADIEVQRYDDDTEWN